MDQKKMGHIPWGWAKESHTNTTPSLALAWGDSPCPLNPLPREEERSWQLRTLWRQRGGRDGPGRGSEAPSGGYWTWSWDTFQCTWQASPTCQTLSTDFQPLEPFPSIFLLILTPTHSHHHALRSPRSRGRWTLSGSVANPSASRLADFSLRDRKLPGQPPAHTPSPLVTLGPNLVPQLRNPLGHLTARPAPLLRAQRIASRACALSLPRSPVGAWSTKQLGRAARRGGGGAGAEFREGRGQAGWEREGQCLRCLGPEDLTIRAVGYRSLHLGSIYNNTGREVVEVPRCTSTVTVEKARLGLAKLARPWGTTPFPGATLDPH